MRLLLDYARWAGARREWSSIGSFVAADPTDGVHSIGSHALPLDLLLVNAAKIGDARERVLPVFLSGAVSARNGSDGPFFSGRAMAEAAGMPALCIADPTLAVHGDLGLAWYAGSQWQATQQVLGDLLEAIADAWQVEPLLIGGSGAGFAALQLGARLGARASVLVWNAQTDLLRYYRPAVLDYLRAAFPRADGWPDAGALETAAAHLARHGVTSAVVPDYAAGARPRRLLFLQNASDEFHLLNHAGPLLTTLDLDARHAVYASGAGDLLFWFGDWGSGHEPVPKPFLASLIERMRDPAWRPADLAALPSASGLAATMPPLSFRHAAREAVLQLDVVRDAGRLVATAALEGVPPGAPMPRFAFYWMAGRERIAQRWYGPDASAIFPLPGAQPPSQVVVFARDSFGTVLRAAARIPAGMGDAAD